MATAKDIVLRPISSTDANALVKRVHYSGKVVQNSQLHIGVFLHGKLEGAMQFGPSLDKRKIQGLVKDTAWHEFVELNRMAFSDALPRNSESRAIAIAMKLLRQHAPQVKWVVSFADATQCGDGTIYRASGFVLTSIRENENTWRLPTCSTGLSADDAKVFDVWAESVGYHAHKMSLEGGVRPNALLQRIKLMMRRYTNGATSSQSFFLHVGAARLIGYQLRYIYFIDPTYRARLNVPELPYSDIQRMGAGMYKGKTRMAVHSANDGASPLQSIADEAIEGAPGTNQARAVQVRPIRSE